MVIIAENTKPALAIQHSLRTKSPRSCRFHLFKVHFNITLIRYKGKKI